MELLHRSERGHTVAIGLEFTTCCKLTMKPRSLLVPRTTNTKEVSCGVSIPKMRQENKCWPENYSLHFASSDCGRF